MTSDTKLFEILVPVTNRVTGRKIPVKVHREWDYFVRSVSGGLTLLGPVKGQWLYKPSYSLSEEKMIPVRISCTREEFDRIMEYTRTHYNQLVIFGYKISDEVILYPEPNPSC